MIVKITDFSQDESSVTYKILDLNEIQLNFLKENLVGEVYCDGNILVFKNYFDKEIFPFKSLESKLKIEDFKAREEIEMTFFLTSLLEDII